MNYRHNCNTCTHLGTYKGYDLYQCNSGVLTKCVARYGAFDYEYIDMPPKYIKLAMESHLGELPDMEALNEARIRIERRTSNAQRQAQVTI